MNDLISRQAAIDAFGVVDDAFLMVAVIKARLKNVTAAQIDMSEYSGRLWHNAYERGKKDAERKTGKWIRTYDKDEWYECSECKNVFSWKPNYCPACGADMRGLQHEM